MLINRPLQKLKRMDWLLALAMLLLAIGSVAFIYSASYREPVQTMPNYYRMQIGWFARLMAWLDRIRHIGVDWAKSTSTWKFAARIATEVRNTVRGWIRALV